MISTNLPKNSVPCILHLINNCAQFVLLQRVSQIDRFRLFLIFPNEVGENWSAERIIFIKFRLIQATFWYLPPFSRDRRKSTFGRFRKKCKLSVNILSNSKNSLYTIFHGEEVALAILFIIYRFQEVTLLFYMEIAVGLASKISIKSQVIHKYMLRPSHYLQRCNHISVN